MTYRELLSEINQFSDEQLDMDLTLLLNKDWFPAKLSIQDGNDILDDKHPFIEIDQVTARDWNGSLRAEFGKEYSVGSK